MLCVKEDSEILNGMFALPSAGLMEQTEALDYLLTLPECTGLMEQKDSVGNTPLYIACSYGNVEAAKLLINNGADVTAQGKDRRNILQTSCLLGHTTTVCYLLTLPEKTDLVKHESKTGFTALRFACTKGHIEIVRLLLENSANIDVKDDIGFTSLSAASASGHTDVVKLLVENGADVETLGTDGKNIFHMACIEGKTDTIRCRLYFFVP
jgi:ankyrin repeat protein